MSADIDALRTNPWCPTSTPTFTQDLYPRPLPRTFTPGRYPERYRKRDPKRAHTRCTMPITPVGIRYISPINSTP